MLDALLALTILAASTPKVAYRPDPAMAADVGTVVLATPRNNCFGVVRASVLLSSRKTDRNRAWAVSVTVADSNAPERILGARLGEAPLRMISVRTGDVACNEYNCPTGSAAVFELGEAPRAALAAAASLPLGVQTSAGETCGVAVPVDKQVLEALEAWAEKLPKPAGG